MGSSNEERKKNASRLTIILDFVIAVHGVLDHGVTVTLPSELGDVAGFRRLLRIC